MEEFPILPMYADDYYIKCISLARMSKGHERYGSILVADGKIIGEGYNRAIAHPSFGRLERKIRQGMANHAEVEALNDALLKGFSTHGAEIYVAGYFPDSGRLFFHSEYTCVRCMPHMRNYGVACVCVPTPDYWVKRPLESAGDDARRYTNGTHTKRLDSVIGEFLITDMAV